MLEKNLNELNIFALRDLARKTGVSSPTSKRKDQLINEIKSILSGELSPVSAKTRQGRPPKAFGYNFESVLSSNIEFDTNSQNLVNQQFCQDVKVLEDEKSLTVAGWLELVNNNSALLWVEKDYKNESYFVSSELLKNVPVKMGDRVVAEVSVKDNSRVIKKIFSLNDCPILQTNINRIDYSSLECVLPSRKLEFDSNEFNALNLKFGENIYVYGNDNNANTIKIIEMLNSCKILNKFYLNISLADKNKIFLSEIKYSEKFLSNITDDVSMAKIIVSLAIERTKRELEHGSDVLLVVDDLNSIFGVDKDLLRNVVSLARETKKGSITLLAVVPNNGMNLIEKLADKKLLILNNKIQNCD